MGERPVNEARRGLLVELETHLSTTALAATDVEGFRRLAVPLLLLLLVQDPGPEAVQVLARFIVVLFRDNDVGEGTALLPDLGVSEGGATSSLIGFRDGLGTTGEECLDILLRVVDSVGLGFLVVEDGLGSVLRSETASAAGLGRLFDQRSHLKNPFDVL